MLILGGAFLNTKTLTQTALCTAFITVCSWLIIPGAVPFTLQTFGVFFTLFILGPKHGGSAVLMYILLGAAGLPVFSGFGAGLGVLCGPTGGYIFGFLAMTACVLIFEKFCSYKVLPIILGLLICYAFGTIWFSIVGGVSFFEAITVCVIPFVLPDLIKLALARALYIKLRRFL